MQVWAWTLTGLYLFITTIIWVEESDAIWDYSYSREDNYEDFKDFRNRSIESQRRILIRAGKIIYAFGKAAVWPLVVLTKVSAHICCVELRMGRKV